MNLDFGELRTQLNTMHERERLALDDLEKAVTRLQQFGLMSARPVGQNGQGREVEAPLNVSVPRELEPEVEN